MVATFWSFIAPFFAVGGDTMAGNMSLFEAKPTTPGERLHIAASVGLLIAALVECLSA